MEFLHLGTGRPLVTPLTRRSSRTCEGTRKPAFLPTQMIQVETMNLLASHRCIHPLTPLKPWTKNPSTSHMQESLKLIIPSLLDPLSTANSLLGGMRIHSTNNTWTKVVTVAHIEALTEQPLGLPLQCKQSIQQGLRTDQLECRLQKGGPHLKAMVHLLLEGAEGSKEAEAMKLLKMK